MNGFEIYRAFINEYTEGKIVQEVAKASQGITSLTKPNELLQMLREKVNEDAQRKSIFEHHSSIFRCDSIIDLLEYYQSQCKMQKILRIQYQPIDTILDILGNTIQQPQLIKGLKLLKYTVEYMLDGAKDRCARYEIVFRTFIMVGQDDSLPAFALKRIPKLLVVNVMISDNLSN